MNLPDEAYLYSIQEQNVYCDYKSKEKNTPTVKKKFKLAGKRLVLLDIYIFFILTSNKASCHNELTLIVECNEWERKDPACLNSTSFISIKHAEPLSRDEIISKCKDKENGFKFVARLPDIKFSELQHLQKIAIKPTSNISPFLHDLISKSIAETMEKLGL